MNRSADIPVGVAGWKAGVTPFMVTMHIMALDVAARQEPARGQGGGQRKKVHGFQVRPL